LIEGCLPSSGGSIKKPAVKASNDAKFRLWVPRDFAVARELQIVIDPKAGQDLAASARQAAIDQIRAMMVEHNITTTDLADTADIGYDAIAMGV